MGQVLPAPGVSYSTGSLYPVPDGPLQGMGRLTRTVFVDDSWRFNVNEYSVYFQLPHDSSGHVIIVTLGSIPEKSWERSKGGTLLTFLSIWDCLTVLVASLVSRAHVDLLFVLFLHFSLLTSSLLKPALARVAAQVTSEENDLCTLYGQNRARLVGSTPPGFTE